MLFRGKFFAGAVECRHSWLSFRDARQRVGGVLRTERKLLHLGWRRGSLQGRGKVICPRLEGSVLGSRKHQSPSPRRGKVQMCERG